MKNLILILSLSFTNIVLTQVGGACIYMLPGDSTIICNIYGNAGVGSQNSCMSDAIAAGALPITCNDYLNGCATFYASNGVGCFYGGTGNCNGGDVCGLLVLPIELISFVVNGEEDKNIITWSTSSEINSDYYSLRVFEDNPDTYEIYNLPAAGTSTEILHYKFIHNYPKKGINYYQLVQYDFDGNYKEYDVISIDNRVVTRIIISKTNLMGQMIDEHYKGLVIIKYDDGTIEKVIQ